MEKELPINQIICSDALLKLKKFPSDSIDTIITSPPYWGLRDYQIEGQIGLEPTLEEYLEKLLQITSELKRVLKKSGVMFWNHGDCYSTHQSGGKNSAHNFRKPELAVKVGHTIKKGKSGQEKCLALQNWRLILKMIDEQGWILRNTIIWNKPNAMPSSVKDRFANKYEPVFMLVKNKKYWFDLDAVRVPSRTYQDFNRRVRDVSLGKIKSSQYKATKEEIERYKKETGKIRGGGANLNLPGQHPLGKNPGDVWEVPYHPSGEPSTGHGMRRPPQPNQEGAFHPVGKNRGDVWQIPTQPCPRDFRGVHFATFPEKLVEPMILAGCPKDGIVLDPFAGSGTTGVVAKKLGRNFLGIELNPVYVKIANERLRATPQPLF